MSDQWINERLTQLRSHKALSDHQRMLLLLADKPVRTEDEERKLAALIKAERAAERAQKARASASRIINAEKLAERKTRDQRSILKAALVDWAVLEGRDLGELLGALLEFTESGMAEDRARWKQQGDTLLAKRNYISPAQHSPHRGK
ncbi:MAG: conjugal transfer protein TraD [Paraburkholderia sp.]|jgi:hypothetical protein|uniref:conjugal transfer protein TraD n=1 Tax=Burkholderiaceae TaxID=119060 RepID=UPI0010F8777D|nr:conjugal transfer protein TraD [Burkholderia sp. 4M9327F10]